MLIVIFASGTSVSESDELRNWLTEESAAAIVICGGGPTLCWWHVPLA